MYKTDGFRALLEVPMLETCMRLWREAHFEVKICKALTCSGVLLDVEMLEKVHVVVGRSTF